MLYYGFFVIFTGGILLTIYLCLVIKWFATHSWLPGAGGPPMAENSDGEKIIELVGSAAAYKYNKGDQEEYCVVCLSKYEEGEEVRDLPRCKHSFHAPCIDKWFLSHLHCPLCRAPVDRNVVAQSEITAGVSDPAVLV